MKASTNNYEKYKNRMPKMQNLIKFLKNQIKTDKPEFISYEKSKSYKMAREYESSLTKEQLDEIRQELKDEINQSGI